MQRSTLAVCSLALITALAACKPAATPPATAAKAPAAAPVASIAWRHGAVDEAFAEARDSGKPVLLYWGAVWCPPCNKLKATLFKDPAFIALTRSFVPVYLDGDEPGAQAWGEQFGIRGYPTLIVLSPDRHEITRLAGGNDSTALTVALQRAAGRRASVADVLQAALQRPGELQPDDWALLADYGWEVDANRLAGDRPLDQLLRQLAAVAPQGLQQRRFALLSLALADADQPPLAAAERARARQVLDAVLASPSDVHANQAALVYAGAALVRTTRRDPADGAALGARLLAAVDADLARADGDADGRLSLLLTEIQLYRDQHGDAALPAALVQRARAAVAAADRGSRTAYERQATISTAASVLDKAGDPAAAEALLLAELPRSHTPYYYMPDLADFAERRGDKAAAIDWLRKAYAGAEGPATRVQWGVLYVEGLVRLAPGDAATIEQATDALIADLATQPQGYHQRTRQRFERLGRTLADWSRRTGAGATLARLQQRAQQGCHANANAGSADERCPQWLSG